MGLVELTTISEGALDNGMSDTRISPFSRVAYRPWSAALSAGVLATLGAAVLFFAGLGSVSLSDPDEGRYAEIPREMLATGDFVTPRLDGVLYFEKPPLYYWLGAASIAVFGATEFACRFWSALLGVGGVGLAYVLGRSAGGSRAGIAAAGIVATAPLYLVMAHLNTIDMTVSFFLAAALTCLWLAFESEHRGHRRLLGYGFFACAALAVLSKGLIGIVIPAATAGLYVLFSRRWRSLAGIPWGGGVVLFLAIAVPWHVVVSQRHPSFLWFYFVHEHLLRYTTTVAERQQPLWFFLPVIALGFLPWTGLLAGVPPLLTRRHGTTPREHRAALFLASWAGFVIVFFSVSESKLVPYVLPAFVPLGVLAALALSAAVGHDGGVRALVRRGFPAAAGALAVAAFAVAWAAAARPAWILPDPGVISSGVIAPLATLAALASVAAAMSCVRWRPTWCLTNAGAAVVCLFGSLLLAAPAVGRSADAMARFLLARLEPGDVVASFCNYPQSLPAYLGRRIDIVDYRGELDFGISHLPSADRVRRFPTASEFTRTWNSPNTVYVVVKKQAVARMKRAGIEPGPVLFRQGDLLLFGNRPPASSLDRTPPEPHS